MNSLEQKRIEQLTAISFHRVIYYCKYVAKINVEKLNWEELDMEEEFNIRLYSESQKIAIGLFHFEKSINVQFPTVDLISIISEIINEMELNTNHSCSDAAFFVASYMRFEVNPKLRIISGIKLRRK